MSFGISARGQQFKAGTVAVTTTVVTGSGANFVTNRVRQGDMFLVTGRMPILIQSVDSETQLTLAYTIGTAVTSTADYVILRNPGDSVLMNALLRELISLNPILPDGSIGMTGDLTFAATKTAILGKDGAGSEAVRASQIRFPAIPFFNRTQVAATNLSALAAGDTIFLICRSVATDFGGGVARKISTPSPVTPLDFQSSDGSWFRMTAAPNVRMSGVTGNGSSTEQTALGNALSLTGFRKLRFPEGDYLFGDPVFVDTQDDRQFEGDGARLFTNAGFGASGGQGIFVTFGASAAARRSGNSFRGFFLDIPGTTTAIAHNLRFSNCALTDVIGNTMLNATTGGYGTIWEASNSNIRLALNSIKTKTYGHLFKPTQNLTLIATDTNQNEHVQVIGERILSDDAGNMQIGVSFDTAMRYAIVVGTMVTRANNAAGLGSGAGEGMGFAVANENDNNNRACHIGYTANLVQEFKGAAFHFEDTLRDFGTLGNHASGGRYGVHQIIEPSETQEGSMHLANHFSDMKDGGLCIDAVSGSANVSDQMHGLFNINYAGHTPLVASTGAGIRAAMGSTAGQRWVFLPNMMRAIVGDGIRTDRVTRSLIMPQMIAASNYALQIRNVPSGSGVYVMSGGILTGTVGDVDASTADRLIGDKQIVSKSMVCNATATDFLFRAPTKGMITSVTVIYETAPAGSVAPVVTVGKNNVFTGGNRMLQQNILITGGGVGAVQHYQLASEFFNPGRIFAAGDLIGVQITAGTGSTHSVKIQVNYFEWL